MKAMTSQDKKSNKPVTTDGFDSTSELVNALNDFIYILIMNRIL